MRRVVLGVILAGLVATPAVAQEGGPCATQRAIKHGLLLQRSHDRHVVADDLIVVRDFQGAINADSYLERKLGRSIRFKQAQIAKIEAKLAQVCSGPKGGVREACAERRARIAAAQAVIAQLDERIAELEADIARIGRDEAPFDEQLAVDEAKLRQTEAQLADAVAALRACDGSV